MTQQKQCNMGTITIHSNKAEDLYFINELARGLNLKTEIDTPSTETTIGRMQPSRELELLKKEDKRLAEMAFLTSSASLENFFENETEKMF